MILKYVEFMNVFTSEEEFYEFSKLISSKQFKSMSCYTSSKKEWSTNQNLFNNYLWSHLRKSCISCSLKEYTATLDKSPQRKYFKTRIFPSKKTLRHYNDFERLLLFSSQNLKTKIFLKEEIPSLVYKLQVLKNWKSKN